MILSKIAFCKRVTCPSSETLVSYGTRALAAEQMLTVSTHLDECDFCGAEFQLLRRNTAREDEECITPAMPSHLRRLAQSLLTADWLHMESLAVAGYEKERLTLTDA